MDDVNLLRGGAGARRLGLVVAAVLVLAAALAPVVSVARAATTCVPPGFAGVSEYAATLPGASCAAAFTGIGLVAPASLRSHGHPTAGHGRRQRAHASAARSGRARTPTAVVLTRVRDTASATSGTPGRAASGRTRGTPADSLGAGTGRRSVVGTGVGSRGAIAGLLAPLTAGDGGVWIAVALVSLAAVAVIVLRRRLRTGAA